MMTSRSSRTTVLTLVAAATAALALGSAGAASATDSPAVPLNTGQEVPAPTVGGAHGWFSYEIDGAEFCYTLEVTGLSSPAAAAHIHVAPRNAPGSIVVPLLVENATSFEVTACTMADAALLAAIEANPKDYYVNVHTPTNMAGEVRGQLK